MDTHELLSKQKEPHNIAKQPHGYQKGKVMGSEK